MEMAPELMPIGERDAKAAFGLTKSGMKRVPNMFTLPGVYTLLPVASETHRYAMKILDRTNRMKQQIC
jgi:hypothetical protein